MIAKLFIVILLIFTIFAGCKFLTADEQEVLRDMNTSREGILSDGVRFIFHGADQVDVTLTEFLEERGFIYRLTFDIVVLEETIEEILEVISMVQENVGPDDFIYIVYYFSESSEVFITLEEYSGRFVGLGDPTGNVVNLATGVVTYYIAPVWHEP